MKTYLCFVLVIAAAPAMAAVVTLTTADTMGQSSFNSGLHWSNGLAPSAGNDYQVNIWQLRTPANGGSYTFAGDSLTINPGGALMYKGTGTAGSITINNLIANGGSVIDHRNGAVDVCNLYGNIDIAADSVMYAKQGPINVYSAVSGSGTITNPGTDSSYCTLTFYSPASTFTGNIVNNGRFVLADNAVLNFVIGTSGVNNSVSGTGPQTTFDGDFIFDLNGAGTIYGDSWQIAGATGQTFGSTFTVAGFVDIGGGLWVTHHTNGTFYQFSQSTGQLSIFWPGSGTPEDPYQIWTPQQMNTIGLYPEIWAYHFRLMADIDMSAYTGTSYHIIGTSWDIPFTGTFDGNGHVIANITITTPDADYVGLFGCVGSGGQICNLGVENVNINGRAAVGGLVGLNNSGTITSCYATGSVSGLADYVGSLVGYNYYGTITACYTTGSVSGSNDVGGLVGYDHEGTIASCYATGSVSGSDDSVGGLVGMNYSSTILSCYATGSVGGSYYVGGLVGLNDYGTIISCYATGSVSSFADAVGGLVGYMNYGTIESCYATGSVIGSSFIGGLVGYTVSGTIESCYATGSVSGSADLVGGLVGTNYSSTIISCYATGSVGGSDYVGGLVGLNDYGTIESCYATGSVSSFADAVGGLVGYMNYGTIESCYATGSVIGSLFIGGLVGYTVSGTITACFWDTQTSGLLDSAGGIGKTTAEMQTISTFIDAGWDFTTKDGDPADWRMPLSSYPKLGWEDYPSYCGDIDHPYPVMDFNQDCRVDLADFALFAAHWLECTAPECD